MNEIDNNSGTIQGLVGPGRPPVEHQFKPGVSGNPAGKPKGTKHVSTWIQELLNDEEFDLSKFVSGKPYKGAPMQAIIITAVVQALQGDPKWADLLFKYGYGSQVKHTGTIKHQPILGGASVREADDIPNS